MPANDIIERSDIKDIKAFLNAHLRKYYRCNQVQNDPVHCIHAYALEEDMETAAFLTAPVAYGRARSIICSSQNLLKALGDHPYEAALNFDPQKDAGRFSGFKHRFTTPEDMLQFIGLTSELLRVHGRLKHLFYDLDSPKRELKATMSSFVTQFRSKNKRLRKHVRYMLPDPADGSACKRFNLFLRWMVRPADGVDLGLWPEIGHHRLIVPLDTHVARISRRLGLLKRKSDDFKAAEEVTEALKVFHAADPVRYDFAMAHLGISGDWEKISPAPR